MTAWLSCNAPRCTTVTWRPAGAWSTSPAGRCPSSTPAASSPSTSPRAGRPACSTSPTWAGSWCAGADALPFLQRVLTNNAAALEVCQAQYTIIADEAGGALDDAYLYRFAGDEYLLVVNAANRLKDWEHFRREAARFADLELRDATAEIAMIALQGPRSRDILSRRHRSAAGCPSRCATSSLSSAAAGATVRVGRTGYTGEPLCFELFVAAEAAARLWDALVAGGATPAGLGARDTLRLEAGLPLYGFELGTDDDGVEIPIFAIPLAKLAVSFSPLKGDFIGRAALARQHDAFAARRGARLLAQSRPAASRAAARPGRPRRRPHAARRSSWASGASDR